MKTSIDYATQRDNSHPPKIIITLLTIGTSWNDHGFGTMRVSQHELGQVKKNNNNKCFSSPPASIFGAASLFYYFLLVTFVRTKTNTSYFHFVPSSPRLSTKKALN